MTREDALRVAATAAVALRFARLLNLNWHLSDCDKARELRAALAWSERNRAPAAVRVAIERALDDIQERIAGECRPWFTADRGR